MKAATCQTCGTLAQRANAFQFDLACRAAVAMTRRDLAAGQGKGMAAFLVHKAEINARSAPLGSVRCDAPTATPVMSEEVRQLVAKGAVDLCSTEFGKARIQRHQSFPREGIAGCGPHACIPADADLGREFGAAKRPQKLARRVGQLRVVIGLGNRTRCGFRL